MGTPWLCSIMLVLSLLSAPSRLPADYEAKILHDRKQAGQSLNDPGGWLSLVALAPLTGGDVSVGSAPGTTVHLEHGLPHAFTLHVDAGRITLAAVDPSVTVDGKHLHPGDTVAVSEENKAMLHWGDLWASAIKRTGNQFYLRIGDPNSPNRRHFHGLHFYPVDPTYRITAKWVPYNPPHDLHMATVLGTQLTLPSPGYAEFAVNGQTVRLDGVGGEKEVDFSFRDATFRTTTYGAGRWFGSELPSNGLQAPGTIVLDFNRAQNWPCAYTEYGTCPLPPKQNRFDLPIAAGEKRYHD